MAAELLGDLQEHIARRYARREGYELTDFLYANHLFRGVDGDFVDFIFAQREELLSLLGDERQRRALTADMAEATRIYTWQRNQYLALPAQTDTLLTTLYDTLVSHSRRALAQAHAREELAQGMREVIDAHHERLLRFFVAVCPADTDGQPAADFLRSSGCSHGRSKRSTNPCSTWAAAATDGSCAICMTPASPAWAWTVSHRVRRAFCAQTGALRPSRPGCGAP